MVVGLVVIHLANKVDSYESEINVKTTKIVAIGDSITYGADPTNKILSKTTYPAQLQRALGKNYRVLNYGVNGATLVTSGDLPYRSTSFYKIINDVDPDIVLIMLGTNDSKPHNWDAKTYKTQLKDFVSGQKSLLSHPQVYLMTPPAAYDNSYGINKMVIRDEIYPIVKNVAAQTNTPYIDIYSATKNHPEYFPDGVHPNAAGYKIIAAKVYTALKKD